MEQISFYLKKFNTLEIKGDRLKTRIIEIIKKELDIELKKEEVLILKTGTVKILKTGPEKTQIFLNKNKLKNKIEKEII